MKGIRKNLDMVVVNGSEERRYPGNLNLSFAYVEGESLLMGLKEVAVSSGSACTSASLEPSYVLRALNIKATGQRRLHIGGLEPYLGSSC
ncbi:cysteine desulfurase 1 [Pyrus ussuriensis x Pyrus communis]|uniref:Cysteine desulfurase 1 n=1 Tax=Pyrus ussuriensis x Pyrus communis TaxID=2448454 RepID=A0A5N5G834_9ROSA|nr:cysteine desulfurase 1 [Pyrus ussuriensis x Pyrus communis]